MNLLRQNSQIPAEQIQKCFVKDKHSWENAISMYQGPDPLDHWYNYICWYENHRHGDPENQFRQTLERCLSLFEHTDYYKQDVRMVRLWLKYIDMQPNPLHFYQVLHTRGVGKQIASFYISWANYYESVNALKEAEAVYNVAFKEKAQSYAELHHAHSKFLYAHASNVPSTPVPPAAPIQQLHQQQQQQYQQVQHMTQQPTHSLELQQSAYGQAAVQRQQVHPQVQIQLQTQQATVHHHSNANHMNVQVQNYRSQSVYQQTTQQPQQQIVYQQRIDVNSYNHSQEHQQQVHQPQFQQTQLSNQQNTYLQHQLAQPPLTPPMGVPIEQQLPATSTQHHQQLPATTAQQEQQSQYYQAQQIPQMQSQQVQQSRISSVPVQQHVAANQDEQIAAAVSVAVPGIKLPKKFANYSQNNYETWKPALFLEEPDDPLRKCHYQKQQVYPDGANIEYSPEELYASKYFKRIQTQQIEQEQPKTYVQIQSWEPVQTVAYEQQGQLNQQQEERVFQQISAYNQGQPQQNINVSSSSNVYQIGATNGGQVIGTVAPSYQTTTEEEEGDQDDYEGYDQAGDDEEDDDEEEDEDYDDDDYDEAVNQPQQQQHAQKQQSTVINTLDDLEDQIEASTIRFSMHSEQQGIQNKTIKIKFRKEPQTKSTSAANSNKSFNGSYSAYSVSVQNVYQNQQQHIKSTANSVQSPKVRSNGHSFHPYLMSQTSTPKTSASTSGAHHSHNRSKLKKINKFPIATGSSSNSSSAENAAGGLQNGHNASGLNSSFHNATFNDNANYSFSSAVALDNSNCSLTSAVDRLNFRDSTFGGAGGQTSKLNSTNIVDFSTYQENSFFATQHDTEAKERRLQKALTTIATHFQKPTLDPFNSELCRAFLTKLDFPNSAINAAATVPNADYAESPMATSGSHLKIVQTPLPKLSNARALYLPEAGNMQFNIDKEVGRGSYGSVYKATDANTGTTVALKYQKPPNTWEIYICDQVLKRIKSPNILPGLMDISTAIIAPNASLIATEFSPFGSLLDVNNKIRQNTTKVMHESLVMHFSAQICNIIYHLHQQKIIHADIKPDNFLLMSIPSTETYLPSLRLIDFGCAIDMTLFPDPDKQKFRKVIQTDGFTCIEMQEGRNWSYETDIFCIAGTVHVMLFGEYMQVQKRAGTWDIKQKLPRYLKKHVWTKFFGEILNIKNGKLPDLKEFHEIFDDEASKMDSELQKQIRSLSNILYRR